MGPHDTFFQFGIRTRSECHSAFGRGLHRPAAGSVAIRGRARCSASAGCRSRGAWPNACPASLMPSVPAPTRAPAARAGRAALHADPDETCSHHPLVQRVGPSECDSGFCARRWRVRQRCVRARNVRDGGVRARRHVSCIVFRIRLSSQFIFCVLFFSVLCSRQFFAYAISFVICYVAPPARPPAAPRRRARKRRALTSHHTLTAACQTACVECGEHCSLLAIAL